MARRRLLIAVAAGLVAALLHASPAPAAAATTGSRPYVAPVDGVIVDHFRPPASAYAAGNRGIDELTAVGAPVVASAAGVVLFAGPVGGTLHITIRHADGLRTSYSFLAEVLVGAGETVEQGQLIGRSAGPFHFGVRAVDGTYLDPEALLAGSLGAHLVPGPDQGLPPLAADDERRGLVQLMAAGDGLLGSAGGRLAAMAEEARQLEPGVAMFELAAEIERWHAAQARCTPPDAAVPPMSRRRIAVLVGGLGSTSEAAAVDGVDLAGLGYAASEVVRFSYRGGRVPRVGAAASGPLESVPRSTYGPLDTEVDLHVSAARLRDLLAAVAEAQPGVPIDVIAHSQGGVVARLALAAAARDGALPSDLGTVVTLGTPHQGADLATAVVAVGPSTPVGSLAGGLGDATGGGLDLSGAAIAQLSQTSTVTAELARPVPAGVHLLSIGASGDLTVPAVRTQVDGADGAIVALGGLHAHDRLPSAPATTREIGLALAGAPPTCQGWAEGVTNLVTSHLVAQAEAEAGLSLAGHPG